MSATVVVSERYANQMSHQNSAARKEEKKDRIRKIADGIRDWFADPVFWNVYDALRSQDGHQLNAFFERWR